jgi:inhibitor of cysteine peptidase
MARMVGRRVGLVAGLAAILGFLSAGCPPIQTTGGDTNEPTALQPFTSAEEMLNYFKDQATAKYSSNSRQGLGGFLGLLAAPTAAAEDTGGASNDSTTSGTYSTTNLQEEGVDEADVFKSDGTNFYLADPNGVRIVKANPAGELAEVGRVTFDGRVADMYLYEGKLIVLGARLTAWSYPQTGTAEIMIWPPVNYGWPPYVPSAKILVDTFDVSTPATPTKVAEIEIDGMLVTSRLTGGRLYLVTTIVPPMPTNPTPVTIAAMTLDQVLPKARAGGAESTAINWANCYHPGTGDGYNLTGVVTLNAADVQQIVGSVAVMADAGTVYASQQALYVTDDDWTWESVVRQTTKVHKFAFDAQVGARYVGSGAVKGRLLNQFSLGEYNGYLRLATHIDEWRVFSGDVLVAGGDGVAVSNVSTTTATAPVSTDPNTTPTTGPSNAVYVLQDTGTELATVGSIENIAPTEKLYSARFLGARGYLVTFRQIDPLFVLDLAQPTAPAIVGQLKIPGYSDYLHPVGDNLLIGVGRSVATLYGTLVEPNAVQLSLFDVSNPAEPNVIQQLSFGGYGSSSEVSYNHKAFTFMADRGLLALPVQLYPTSYNPETSWVYTGPSFDGTLVLSVASTGFTELGRVASVVQSNTYGMTWLPWRRAPIIGNTAYAVSPGGVRAANLSDFVEVKSVSFPLPNWYGLPD